MPTDADEAQDLRGLGSLTVEASVSGSGGRGARIHTSCAVVSAPTFDRAFARGCFTVETSVGPDGAAWVGQLIEAGRPCQAVRP